MKARFLGLHTCNLGSRTRTARNPFTGEAVIGHIDDGMTPEQAEAASAFLKSAGASEPDPDGFRKVSFANGGYAHAFVGPIGAEIQFDGPEAPEAAGFVFQLAAASGMVIASTIDPAVVAVPHGLRHAGIDARWPDAVDVESEGALEAWVDAEVANGRIV